MGLQKVISKILGQQIGCCHDPRRVRTASDRSALLVVPPGHPRELRAAAAVPRVSGQVELPPAQGGVGVAPRVRPPHDRPPRRPGGPVQLPDGLRRVHPVPPHPPGRDRRREATAARRAGLDESYFGGKRKGKRGRGAGGKVAVFGILERAGRVYTVAVPDCKKETLMAKIEAATVKGSVFYTDEFTSYNDVQRHGKHVPVNHQEAFAVGRAHINGIEGFWSFAKRLYRHVHGVDSGNFPLYLAEYEFRYNHRGEHLMDLLYDRMIRPTIPTQTVP
ncbi:MAG: IS1595 family transposase [Gemmataceae bacterium]